MAVSLLDVHCDKYSAPSTQPGRILASPFYLSNITPYDTSNIQLNG